MVSPKRRSEFVVSRGGADDEVSVSPSWFLAFNFLAGICGQNGSAASKARNDCNDTLALPLSGKDATHSVLF